MKVTIEKSFPMPASAEAGWSLLSRIEAVAACMPGARITEKIDDTHYKGTVAVKFGPANMNFKGDIEVKQLDAGTRTLRMVGKGTDSTGTSGASMDLTAHAEAVDGEHFNLVGKAEVSVSGKAAAFGNRLMGSVADQVLKQFATRFADEVRLVQGKMPAPAATAPADAPAGSTTPSVTATDTPATAPAPAPVPAPLPAPEPTQLNAFALLWGMVRDWLRGLFGGGKKGG